MTKEYFSEHVISDYEIRDRNSHKPYKYICGTIEDAERECTVEKEWRFIRYSDVQVDEDIQNILDRVNRYNPVDEVMFKIFLNALLD